MSLSVRQFAAAVGISRECVTSYIRGGRLPASIVNPAAKRLTYRIDESLVDEIKEEVTKRKHRSLSRNQVKYLIADIRDKHGLKNSHIAKLVGVSRPCIDRYLWEENTASQETIDKLVKLYEIDDLDEWE